MANLASYTHVNSWLEHNPGMTLRVVEASVTLSSMGSATNKIPASVFGLSAVKEVTPFTKSDNSVSIMASPSADGSLILLKAAGTNAPADYSGDYTFIVKGIE